MNQLKCCIVRNARLKIIVRSKLRAEPTWIDTCLSSRDRLSKRSKKRRETPNERIGVFSRLGDLNWKTARGAAGDLDLNFQPNWTKRGEWRLQWGDDDSFHFRFVPKRTKHVPPSRLYCIRSFHSSCSSRGDQKKKNSWPWKTNFSSFLRQNRKKNFNYFIYTWNISTKYIRNVSFIFNHYYYLYLYKVKYIYI